MNRDAAARHDLPARGMTSDDAAVAIGETETGYLTQVAGWSGFEAAAGRMPLLLGLTLPATYSVPARAGEARAWRLAPDRLLLRTATPPGLASTGEIAILDLSQARICLSISGPGAARLPSCGVAPDVREEAFPTGSFVQTGLHHVGVLIERSDRDGFLVVIPTTWSRSPSGLLTDHLLLAA